MDVRRRLPRHLLFSSIALALLSPTVDAGAQQLRGAGYRSRLDTTFAFAKGGTVNINAGPGDIIVTGSSRDQFRAHATSENENIRFDVAGDRITLEAVGSYRGSDARFEISVPYGTRVVARTQAGDISIRGTRGQIEARTQSGDIEIDDVTTRLDVNTFSGDVTVEGVAGDAEIVTVSGDVRVTDIKGSFTARTVSGDVALHDVVSKLVRINTTNGDLDFAGAIDPLGRYDFTTHSGDIELRIPRDSNAQLSLATWNGGIDSGFPITLKPGEHGIGTASTKRFSFDIGAGAARITAETFGGDITISPTISRSK
jgi:DUF4097 and DUF4098 domain-containing protein YvlB